MSLLTVTVTVTPALSSITAVQADNIAIAVTGSGITPTGTVVLSCAATGYASSPAVLVAGDATIAVPGAALAVGSNTLTATYTPDVTSDSVYNVGTTGTATVTVTGVAIVPCKLQGYKAKLTYVPVAGGAAQLLFGVKNLDGEFKADELDSSDHGGSWKGRMYGMLDFTASAEVDYIAGDASQEALLAAILGRNQLTINLYPDEGTGTGVDAYTGQVVISSFKWSGKMKDLQSATFAMSNASNQGFTVTPQ